MAKAGEPYYRADLALVHHLGFHAGGGVELLTGLHTIIVHKDP